MGQSISGKNLRMMVEQAEDREMAARAAAAAGQEVKLLHTEGKNTDDVKALERIITEQLQKGAMLPTDLEAEAYRWENGRLVGLFLYKCYLNGNLSLNGLYALQWANLNHNRLENLDVTGNQELVTLDCDRNRIKKLDVSANKMLQRLSCDGNGLETLIVKEKPQLTVLSCYENRLTELDIKECPALVRLFCKSNQIKCLNISRCPDLTDLSRDPNIRVRRAYAKKAVQTSAYETIMAEPDTDMEME